MLASQASYTGSIPVSRSIYQNMTHRVWRSIQIMTVVSLGAVLAGCATVRKPQAPELVSPAATPKTSVTHKVSRGETIWRIARAYKVSVDDIIQANHIPNAASLEENQLLTIPGATEVLAIPPDVSVGKDSDYAWPLKGRIVSYFQDRKGAYINSGLDIKSVDGDIVRAARDGKVVFADHLAGYGATVILDHADGFFTVYGHNERLLVNLGDKVFKGEKLGQLGTGESAAYAHFEMRKGDKAKNPLHYLPREM